MFLFERLFGICAYMIVLILVCFILVKTNVSCKAILGIYLICLCVMAFFYKPYITADLYRIFVQMDYFSTMDFNLFWNDYALESSIPISRLLFWIFGNIGINSLLPVFSGFFCYTLIFYIIIKTKQLYDISNKTIAIVLFFIMTTSMYISVIGGIRMMLALTMIAFSFFRATVEKRITLIGILFFISSIFIHEMSIVVIAIVAMTLLFDSNKNILKRIGLGVTFGIIGIVFAFKFNDTVYDIYLKFLEYVFGDKHSDIWEYLMGFLIIISLILISVKYHYIRRENEYINVNKCNLATVFSICIAICFCFEFSIFFRFGGHVALLFSIPSMMITLEKTRGKASLIFKGIDLRTIVILLSCIIALISCTRGSLCSLKFFEL